MAIHRRPLLFFASQHAYMLQGTYLELVSAAMASYGGSGVARSLYYYRTGEVIDKSMIHRLKTITRNSSAAHELLSELRYFLSIMLLSYYLATEMYLIILLCVLCVCDRADTSLDFIALYNANKDTTHTISLLQRKGGEENQSEEPLAELAALKIQSTRSSMSIQVVFPSLSYIYFI
jgi:hypothetical protein